MDLLSAAERLASLDQSAVVLDTNSCIHSRYKFANCEACYGICPLDAISAGKPPELDRDKCASCMACLTVCPTGAYQADDAVTPLINSLAKSQAKHVELVCRHNTNAEYAAPGSDVAMLVRGCLAGIGAGGYTALLALGIEEVFPRLDACQDCVFARNLALIHSQIETARRLLASWDRADNLSPCDDLSTLLERPGRLLLNADSMPMSRRDFFRVVLSQGRMTTARMLNKDEEFQGVRRPGRDRRRLVASTQLLPPPDPGKMNTSLSGLGFGTLQVTEACTACGVCESVCPTATLQISRHEGRFELSYKPQYCTGCGLCLEVCTPEALKLELAPTFQAVFASEHPVRLMEGQLVRCQRCGVSIAARPGVKYCPACEFRRANPLGIGTPPGMKR